MQIRDVLDRLRQDGWVVVKTVGSHRQLKHPTKPGKVTVAGHPSAHLNPATLKSILKQANLD
jgi:predicted RNA binding protein YcfA (HicA-like mRNA interferase family)